MSRRVLIGAATLAVAIVALVGVAWAVDNGRGLELAGRPVGHRPDDLIEAVAADYGETHIVVRTPEGALRTSAAELGMSVDRRATRRAVDDAGSAGPIDWLRGLFGRRNAPLIVEVDDARARAVVREHDPTERTQPVEPSIEGGKDGIEIKRGSPGKGLDAAAIAEGVESAARSGDRRLELDAEAVPLAPRFSIADAEALADRARAMTGESLEVRAGTTAATIGTSTLRSWLRSNDDLDLTLAEDKVLEDLGDALGEATVEPVDAMARIEGGRPVIIRGRTGVTCCTADAPTIMLDALHRREPRRSVTVRLRVTQPARTSDDVRALHIEEQTATFTTNFPAGQSRVKNIHRIAELVDGTIIEPGTRFSVNDHVGKRTTDKGFVTGGVIENGTFTESVGGGVSQFATTLFNAAFFGGLDVPKYQSHSIYITRYPYGREATLSWPGPDLVIANTTPHGVLIDTSYTGTSVTATLWSTRFATGEQTNQTEQPVGECKRVRTERTRHYVDGTTKADRFFATYRPAEGVKC